MLLSFDGIELGRADGPLGHIGVSEFDPSYPEIRSADQPREARDGVIPGRDYFGARSVSFDIWTNRRTMAEARETIGEVLRAWRRKSARLESGILVPLDFCAAGDGGRWRRLYGRPRRSDDPDFGVLMRGGRAQASLEFEVLDPLIYETGLQSVTLPIVETYGSDGSWVPPWTWPITPGSGSSEVRAGAMDITGEEATPALIEFHGPGRRFSLDGSRGWHIGLRPSVELAYDEIIYIDPLTRTVRDNFGNDRFGVIDRRSTLTDITLDPGSENVFFSATDPTHRAYAVISWRPAYSSLA